jgi:thiamine kinase-like enzyme
MIPEEKAEPVARAMRETFGVTDFEDITRMTKGNSTSRVFRIVVRGTPYLLRMNLRQDSPARHFANHRAAAEAGLAPKIWYANVEDKVSITDFVEPVPFPAEDALVRMPVLLRAVHALPPFEPVPNRINTSCLFLLNQGPEVDGFVAKFRESNLVPKGEADEVFARIQEIAAIYPRRDEDMVSSHNDVKPENILFDGQRAWLVDWEASFLNDRYSDLAFLSNFLVMSDADECAYLQAYFGHAPDEYERARFFVLRTVFHLFHATGFLFLTSMRGCKVDPDEPGPEFADFLQRNWSGEIDMGDNANRIAYGKAHWARLVHNLQQARFQESMRVVSR